MGQSNRFTGDDMSRKQLLRSVREGRLVTFDFLTESMAPITGYLCGMDAFHWMVVTPDNDKVLIHKGQAAVVRLHDDSTFDQEVERDLLAAVVEPFRAYVQRELSPAREPRDTQGEQQCATSTPRQTASV